MSTNLHVSFHALPLSLAQLSLTAVLKCGQSFRWTAYSLEAPSMVNAHSPLDIPLHEYRFALKDRVVCLRQTPERLYYRSVSSMPSLDTSMHDAETLGFIRDYFQLDVDLPALYDEWSVRDPVFRRLRERFCGIRMLRQNPWENLISFICSSNNHINRITKMVQSLCTEFSPVVASIPSPTLVEQAKSEILSYHAFPTPEQLAAPGTASRLRELGFGYRAEFIQKTAQMLLEEHGSGDGVEKYLMSLRNQPTAVVREELVKLMGVGRKVADCVCLMSLDKREVVPVDTHVHQIAVKYYGLPGSRNAKTSMTRRIYDAVNDKLVKIWGDYAGWAHSVLFTADLKSFASYGLDSDVMPTTPENKGQASIMLPTPGPTPSPTKKRSVDSTDLLVFPENCVSLVEGVKRRKRNAPSRL